MYGTVRRDVLPESSAILEMERVLLNRETLEERMDDGHFDVREGFESESRLSMPLPPAPIVQSRPSTSAAPPSSGLTVSLQDVSTNKDGKKRIRPVLVQQVTPFLVSPTKQYQSQRTALPLAASPAAATDGKKRQRTLSSIMGPGNENQGQQLGTTVINSTFTLPVIQLLKHGQNVLSVPSVRPFFSVHGGKGGNVDAVEFKNNANGNLVVGCVLMECTDGCCRLSSVCFEGGKSSMEHFLSYCCVGCYL